MTAYYENVQSLAQEKRQAIRIAKQLGYAKEVVDKIKNAKRVGDIYNAMHDARLAM